VTVDVWNVGSNYDDYEFYDTATGKWRLGGKTPDLLTKWLPGAWRGPGDTEFWHERDNHPVQRQSSQRRQRHL